MEIGKKLRPGTVRIIVQEISYDSKIHKQKQTESKSMTVYYTNVKEVFGIVVDALKKKAKK